MKIGAAFGEHIKTEKLSKKHYHPDKQRVMRTFFLFLFLIIFPGIVLCKLIDLQLVHGSYYRDISDTNRTRTHIVHAPRGIIFDRNGIPLVYNIPGFREINGEKATLLTRDRAIDLLSEGKQNLEIDSLRQYPYKQYTAHVLGYIGQATKEELSQSAYGTYNATDRIGKTGIERTYESVLRGTDGKELIEVDALGKKIRTLGQTDPIPGHDITLSLDAKLQSVAYDALPANAKGVVIASTPKGEILVMVSKPSYDTNLFTMDQSYSATGSAYTTIDAILMDSTNQPMMNRAVSGIYPPGSTFKIVTAAAGLEQNVIDESYTVEDTGIIHVGEFSFANWFFLEQGKKDGRVNVVKAISRSNDIFFYKLAEKLHVDRLSAFAEKFGLGHTLGIDLGTEAEGIVPSNDWKKKVIGEQWYLGDSYHYGIGQGYLLTTPLQVNSWTETIANGGTVYKPQLLKQQKPIVKRADFLSDTTTNLIRQGMIDSCKTGGVAWPLFGFKVQNPKLPIDGKNVLEVKVGSDSANVKQPQEYREIVVACKTGTAQHGGDETLPHAWITLFAPAYNPQIVVTVLVESGGQGSTVAAPVAKKVLEAWFAQK